MLDLLPVHRNGWQLLAIMPGLLMDENGVILYVNFVFVIGYNAYSMDTYVRDISYEVNTHDA